MTVLACKFCSNPLGSKYVTLIGPTQEDTFHICWECHQHTDTDNTRYHPSIHDDGPPRDQ